MTMPPLLLAMFLAAVYAHRLHGGAGLEVSRTIGRRDPSLRFCCMLVLRGGGTAKPGASDDAPEPPVQDMGPDDEAGTMPYYPPGSLPAWAQEIVQWRNMTMEERVAHIERQQAATGFNPEEDCEEGFTSSESISTTAESSSSCSADSLLSSASGVFSASDGNNSAETGRASDQPQSTPRPGSNNTQRVAKSIEEAQAVFNAIDATVAREKRAAPEEAANSNDPRAADKQPLTEPRDLYYEDDRYGLQRIRLRSTTSESEGAKNTTDSDYPGVDLSSGKVTDKGVFESVEQRQSFIDAAEEAMGRKFDPRVLAAGGQVRQCPGGAECNVLRGMMHGMDLCEI